MLHTPIAAPGFVTHEWRNRRVAFELTALYLLACQISGAFALSLFIVMVDPEHLPIADPAGYFLRYGLPVLALSALFFWFHLRRHARAVTGKLKIREVDARNEPRFVALAQEQCIAQGVKLPRFGVWEASALNALTVGDGPRRGLIAVTRGLIDGLDDDELAAVLAHEAAHIRNGDTLLLAVNHALHRTATSMSLENPFRFDHWAVFLLILVVPLLLPVYLGGHLATWLATSLSWRARGRLAVRRDHLADAAAVRATHDPAALVSAIRKAAANGRFDGLVRVAGLTFESCGANAGVPTATAAERIAAVTALSGALMTMTRTRRDTRTRRFGRATASAPTQPAEPWLRYDASGRPLARPPRPDRALFHLVLAGRVNFSDWLDASYAWWEWRPEDRRIAGLKPQMIVPLLATITFLGVFHWPADGRWQTLASELHPRRYVEIGHKFGLGAGRFCSGPSYPDGKCPE